MAERRKRARDSDAAEALVQLSKHPRIEGEYKYDGESLNGGDAASRTDDDPTLSGGDASSRADKDPANSAGLVSQLQQAIATVRCENSKLEAENKELQQKTHELSLRIAGLESEKLTVAVANFQLAAQNHRSPFTVSISVRECFVCLQI